MKINKSTLAETVRKITLQLPYATDIIFDVYGNVSSFRNTLWDTTIEYSYTYIQKLGYFLISEMIDNGHIVFRYSYDENGVLNVVKTPFSLTILTNGQYELYPVIMLGDSIDETLLIYEESFSVPAEYLKYSASLTANDYRFVIPSLYEDGHHGFKFNIVDDEYVIDIYKITDVNSINVSDLNDVL